LPTVECVHAQIGVLAVQRVDEIAQVLVSQNGAHLGVAALYTAISGCSDQCFGMN